MHTTHLYCIRSSIIPIIELSLHMHKSDSLIRWWDAMHSNHHSCEVIGKHHNNKKEVECQTKLLHAKTLHVVERTVSSTNLSQFQVHVHVK